MHKEVPDDMRDEDCSDYEYDAWIEAKQSEYIRQAGPYQREIRDRILSITTLIENSIEYIIAWHFCKNSKALVAFISLLFKDGQISFNQKTVILKKLLRKFYPDLDKQIGKLLYNPLDDVRNFRNLVAHYNFKVPDFGLLAWGGEDFEEELEEELKAGGLQFEKYQGGERLVEHKTADQIEKITNKSKGLLTLLESLQKEIVNRATGTPPSLLDERWINFVKKYISGEGLKMRQLTSPPKQR